MTDQEAASEVAREKQALAGERHWPSPWMTFDGKMVAVLDDLRERPRYGVIVGNSFGNTTHLIANEVNQRDADRIVACVNAMAGVPDPEKLMETVRDLVDMSRHCTELSFVSVHHDGVSAIAVALEGVKDDG